MHNQTWHTVILDILVFNKYVMLKVRAEKFLYNSFCTKIFQDEILSLPEFFCTLYIRKRKRSKRMHGGVRKRLLYSRIPCIQGDMTGSYGRGAGV